MAGGEVRHLASYTFLFSLSNMSSLRGVGFGKRVHSRVAILGEMKPGCLRQKQTQEKETWAVPGGAFRYVQIVKYSRISLLTYLPT